MEKGEIVNGLSSKMWIERYRDNGDFTFVAPVSSNMRSILPIGTFVTHSNTFEVMIVENHEITDNNGQETTIKITGRSMETLLERRVVVSNPTHSPPQYPLTAPYSDYALSSDFTWNQAVTLISDHILGPDSVNQYRDPNMIIPYIKVNRSITGSGQTVARTVPRGDLYSALKNLLAIENLGIQTIRPHYGTTTPQYTVFNIHNGLDLSETVNFSYNRGELINSDYLWSDKKIKNCAVVRGTYFEVFVTSPSNPVGLDRRVMYIDASSLDKSYSSPISATDQTIIQAALRQKGLDVLAAQKEIALVKAEINKTSTTAKYRTDYNIGDIVGVMGAFSENAKMRVIEHVEAEDSSGETSYPTLANV